MDNGGEYQGETLRTVATFLDEHGITHEQTSPYSSASNGVAERINRNLMDTVRPMLLTSGLPSPFCGEALHTAVKIRNRLPTSSLENNISPHQAWFGHAPKIDHLHVFGCVCFVRITHPETKVQTRSEKCCFLGYEGSTQYRVFDPQTNKVRSQVRNVTFIEDKFLDRTAFLRVPYADRPLQVPEPRNYTEEDQKLDENELAELFPEIVDDDTEPPLVPRLPYKPVAEEQIQQVPRSPPRLPIPPPVAQLRIVDSLDDRTSDESLMPTSMPSLVGSANPS